MLELSYNKTILLVLNLTVQMQSKLHAVSHSIFYSSSGGRVYSD